VQESAKARLLVNLRKWRELSVCWGGMLGAKGGRGNRAGQQRPHGNALNNETNTAFHACYWPKRKGAKVLDADVIE
jgi:hypothetical protein